jgi:hypothetical protein
MIDRYVRDVAAWAERQANLLRRLARGEHINDQPDGPISARKSRTWQPARDARFAIGSLCFASIC